MATEERDQRNERDLLVDVLLGLRVDRVREFMDSVELPRSGTKAELRECVEEALLSDVFSLNILIDYLDRVEPWGPGGLTSSAEVTLIRTIRRDHGVGRHPTDVFDSAQHGS